MKAAAVGVVVAVVASLLAVAIRDRLERGSESPVVVTDQTSRVDMPHSGIVVSLSRPGFVELPIRLGLENAFVVSVTAAEPVAVVELLAGADVVARVVPQDAVANRTDRLTWVPDTAGPFTVLARAYDGRGHVGQSNPIRAEVRAPGPVAGITTVTSVEGDTLAGIAARFGVDPASIANWNALGDLAPDVPLAAGTAIEVPLTLPAGAATGGGRSVAGRVTRAAEPQVSIPPMPAGLTLAAAPTLQVSVNGCGAIVAGSPGAGGQDLVLLEVPPTGGAFVPVTPLPGAPVSLPLTTGLHDFAVAASVGGSLVAWSAPVSLPVTDTACSGWQGAARLDGSHLIADTGADAAYLYLSTTPSEWVRVPTDGFVARGADGFDFSGLLPPLAGSTLSLEAWGRTGGALTFIGSGTYTPPPAPPPSGNAKAAPSSTVQITDVIPFPKTQLWWLRPADWKHAGDPPKAVTSGDVAEPTTLKFQWSAPWPGVTHGIVEVTAAPVPPLAGPMPGGVLYLKVVLGNGGTFDIDFEKVVKAFYANQSGAVSDAGAAFGSKVYQVLAGLPGQDAGSATSTPLSSPHPIDLNPLDDFDKKLQEHLGQLFVVRVVPMLDDSWTGLVSNDVSLNVDLSGLLPVAPAGEKPYALDVSLVQAPKPPDPWKMNCWQFVGWTDDAALQQKLAEEQQAASQSFSGVNLGTYTVWKTLVDNVGSGPICGGCYHFGSLTVSVAGAECSDSGFFGDLFQAFKTLVNMLSSAFAYIKATIVDLVVSATGCKAAGDSAASFCSTLASAALDAALVSLGIPPSLPNWDQLMAAAKGDIVQIGVGLATQLGVPCDQAGFAAEVDGQQGLTCEAAIGALLDEAEKQIDQLYADTAKSMGFDFPALMKVRPHPSGQVQPAAIKITVTPTKYTAAEGGATCSVGAYPSSTWTGQIDFAATFQMGGQVGGPIVSGIVPDYSGAAMSGPVKIPGLVWTGKPFENAFWELPNLNKDPNSLSQYQPASRTYELYPPAELAPVQVSMLQSYQQSGVTDSQGKPVPFGVAQFWYQWPTDVFLLNKDASFSVLVTSGCASGTGVHTWKLPGYGPGLPQEVGG